MARPALDPRSAWLPVAEALALRLKAPRGAAPLRAAPFEAAEGGWALGAVDGGSAMVLEGGGLAVGAVRAAALAWRGHAPLHELDAPLELRLLDDRLAAELEAALPGLPPPEGPASLLERLRALREWEAAMALAARLGEGDVLAVDGPLAQRDWPAARLDELAAQAGRRGVELAGVCKGSSVLLAGQPALVAAARAARGVPEPWAAPLPFPVMVRSHAVRFLRGARVFRVETWPGADAEVVLARLAPWTRDAGYPGYPYPLALAHNRCALDDGLVADLAHALRGLAAQRGVAPEDWEEAFGDFHEVLDRGL